MKVDELKEFWKQEEESAFKGWDFSYIDERKKEEPLPWDYRQIVEGYMDSEKILLDMGTGGGEFLLSLNPSKGKTYATESYLPNIELCLEVLPPHGIEVRAVSDDADLPFKDNFFDVIINRHESFSLKEIKRILKPGGVFITQQVGGRNNKELSRFLLGVEPNIIDCNFNLEEVLQEAKHVGLRVLNQAEYFPKARFYDIGALVYFAKIIQWEFPNFSVEKCCDKLVELQEQLQNQGYIESVEHRFLIVVEKQ